jgi:hypothetical protein
MRFEAEAQLSLAAAFDGGRIASDGGLLWLSEADSVLGLCEAIASRVPEWRKRGAFTRSLCSSSSVFVGGRVRELLTKVRMHLASEHPGQIYGTLFCRRSEAFINHSVQ